ncbi:hypothetical protein [Nocardia donostiensis]|uniref:PPE family domain-containing protein n=1 Tax=Nocardia donostiensis TaxID=1538463 RepID=A0A1V2TCM1_9NOCA|nr:hypothetical protein [Nocardia donostiensis]ONM47260.1 hypothetical protein B0T46_18455 [Nocardia donostiensis]OQS16564.1 hypothetical protein B0T36_02415 [Nocardia donostiensis]OQS21039.1 hypothetical protein B0T44_08385 [Nocardia donostiensis]
MASLGQWVSALGLGEAERNKNNDTQLVEDQKTKWDSDRAIVNGEWSGLLAEYDSDQFAPPAITVRDPFETMTHQQIYDALQDVKPGEINTKADGWRNLTIEARDAIGHFTTGVEAAITEHWSGQSGAAAIDGTRAFATSFQKLAASFQMVAHGLDLTEGHLAQAKASVGKPDSVTVGDKFISALPMQNVIKGPAYRAAEAQETARWVMTTYYRPGVEDVDTHTPILPQPKNPVDDGTTTGDNSNNRGRPSPGSTQQPTNTGNPNTDTEGDPQQQNQQQNQQEQPTTPQSTTPAATPQSTVPAGTPQTPNTDLPKTTTTPGTPYVPSTPGAPGNPGTPSQTPAPGRSIPGTPGTPGNKQPTSSTQTHNAGKPGRTGMPGMMSPAARGGQGDDDDEHKTPDYLIYDRGSELLGTQPPALPPGGVIGG